MSRQSEAFTFTAPLWQWQAKQGTAQPGSWCFVTVPPEVTEEVRASLVSPPRGFGSVRVEVSTGSSRWRTSLFPDAASGCFVLPVKKAVRVAEGVEEGDELRVTLRLED